MLDLRQDPVALTAALVDVPSVSGTERPLADPEGNEFCAFLPETDATNDADAEVPV